MKDIPSFQPAAIASMHVITIAPRSWRTENHRATGPNQWLLPHGSDARKASLGSGWPGLHLRALLGQASKAEMRQVRESTSRSVSLVDHCAALAAAYANLNRAESWGFPSLRCWVPPSSPALPDFVATTGLPAKTTIQAGSAC